MARLYLLALAWCACAAAAPGGGHGGARPPGMPPMGIMPPLCQCADAAFLRCVGNASVASVGASRMVTAADQCLQRCMARTELGRDFNRCAPQLPAASADECFVAKVKLAVVGCESAGAMPAAAPGPADWDPSRMAGDLALGAFLYEKEEYTDCLTECGVDEEAAATEPPAPDPLLSLFADCQLNCVPEPLSVSLASDECYGQPVDMCTCAQSMASFDGLSCEWDFDAYPPMGPPPQRR